jgi:hypothetical protein
VQPWGAAHNTNYARAGVLRKLRLTAAATPPTTHAMVQAACARHTTCYIVVAALADAALAVNRHNNRRRACGRVVCTAGARTYARSGPAAARRPRGRAGRARGGKGGPPRGCSRGGRPPACDTASRRAPPRRVGTCGERHTHIHTHTHTCARIVGFERWGRASLLCMSGRRSHTRRIHSYTRTLANKYAQRRLTHRAPAQWWCCSHRLGSPPPGRAGRGRCGTAPGTRGRRRAAFARTPTTPHVAEVGGWRW